jgi:hypothetical protein
LPKLFQNKQLKLKKMKIEFKSTTSRSLIIFSSACILIFSIFMLSGCKKEKKALSPIIGNDIKTTQMRKLNTNGYEAVDNPYKVENVLTTIARYRTKLPQFLNYQMKPEQIDVFVKIKAEDIPADKINSLRKSIDFFDYPMDAAMLYEPGLTEEKLNTLKDGFIYATLPKNSNMLLDAPFTKIYEIYKPSEAEKWLHLALLFDGDLLNDADKDILVGKFKKMELPLDPSDGGGGGGGGGGDGGTNDDDGNWWDFIIPVSPKGRIKYTDTRLGDVGVINVKVIAFRLYGNDVAWTDVNGNFTMTGSFWIGTTITCKFVNNNIDIAPRDRRSGFNATVNVFNSFIVGALTFPIVHNKSQMQNVNITFNDINTQANFWSHIINMNHFHRSFCLQEGILPAPSVQFRAAWEDKQENAAGTTMVPNIANNFPQNIAIFKDVLNINEFGAIFIGGLTSAASNIIKLFVPDVTVSSGPTYITNFTGNSNYSSDISKTILHELSHASMYSKVGNLYWLTLGMQEIKTDDGGNYGWGNITTSPWLGGSLSDVNKAFITPMAGLNSAVSNNTFDNTCDNFIELSEAWAEFLGENYARRIYTGAAGSRMCNPLGGGANGNLNNFPLLPLGKTPYTLFTLSSKMESGHAWADIWIPCGMFHDLMDVTNTITTEPWDNVGGYTIAQMYNAFDISRPAHVDYLTFLAPIKGYTYSQLFPLYDENAKP